MEKKELGLGNELRTLTEGGERRSYEIVKRREKRNEKEGLEDWKWKTRLKMESWDREKKGMAQKLEEEV